MLKGPGLLRSASAVVDEKTWMPAFAGMTVFGLGASGAKVFCGAFFQKSDLFL